MYVPLFKQNSEYEQSISLAAYKIDSTSAKCSFSFQKIYL